MQIEQKLDRRLMEFDRLGLLFNILIGEMVLIEEKE